MSAELWWLLALSVVVFLIACALCWRATRGSEIDYMPDDDLNMFEWGDKP